MSETRNYRPAAEKVAEPVALTRPPERMITIVWRQFRRHPMAIAGSTILLIIVLAAVLAPLWPHDPEDLDVRNRWQRPSLEHPMGTDRSGRDLLARILWGGRISLTVGMLASMAGGWTPCSCASPTFSSAFPAYLS
jgi:peptide/nickel transport system permease protein